MFGGGWLKVDGAGGGGDSGMGGEMLMWLDLRRMWVVEVLEIIASGIV